jgi:hypothetical protein
MTARGGTTVLSYTGVAWIDGGFVARRLPVAWQRGSPLAYSRMTGELRVYGKADRTSRPYASVAMPCHPVVLVSDLNKLLVLTILQVFNRDTAEHGSRKTRWKLCKRMMRRLVWAYDVADGIRSQHVFRPSPIRSG